MNIKDFLIDNYIWIIVVILLIIITIIGFLADKKKGKEPKNGTPAPIPNNAAPNNAAPAAPMNYQPVANQNNVNMQNAGPVNFGTLPNSSVTPINAINQPNGINIMNNTATQVNDNMNNSLGNASAMAPTPVEPINNNVANAEPMYQPLSEQKPSFSPAQNLSMNLSQVSETPSSAPTPVVNNGVVLNNQPVQAEPMAANQIQDQAPLSMPNVIPNQLPGNGNVTPSPIPTPSVPAPAPQPIPDPNQINNNNVTNLNNNTVPNAVTTPQPISFVYGQQNNNNGTM